jgi:hypothetical protein
MMACRRIAGLNFADRWLEAPRHGDGALHRDAVQSCNRGARVGCDLDQQPAGVRRSGLGDLSLGTLLVGGVLARHDTEEPGQRRGLATRVKSPTSVHSQAAVNVSIPESTAALRPSERGCYREPRPRAVRKIPSPNTGTVHHFVDIGSMCSPRRGQPTRRTWSRPVTAAAGRNCSRTAWICFACRSCSRRQKDDYDDRATDPRAAADTVHAAGLDDL